MSEFTKGEWQWIEVAEDDYRLIGEKCREVIGIFLFEDDTPSICIKKEDKSLIAAAPEMYEALEYAIRFLDPKEVDVAWLKRIRAKSKGESE